MGGGGDTPKDDTLMTDDRWQWGEKSSIHFVASFQVQLVFCAILGSRVLVKQNGVSDSENTIYCITVMINLTIYRVIDDDLIWR